MTIKITKGGWAEFSMKDFELPPFDQKLLAWDLELQRLIASFRGEGAPSDGAKQELELDAKSEKGVQRMVPADIVLEAMIPKEGERRAFVQKIEGFLKKEELLKSNGGTGDPVSKILLDLLKSK